MIDTIPTYHTDTLHNVINVNSISTESAFEMLPLHNDFFSLPWVIISLFILFLLYCVVVSTSLNYLGMEWKMIFSEKESTSFSIIFSSQYVSSKLILTFLSVFSISYFLFRIVHFFTGEYLPYLIFFFLAVLFLFLSFSYFLMFLIGMIFFRQKQSAQYIKKYFLFFSFAGIVLFPLAILSIYAPSVISAIVLWVALLVIIILEIALIYKLLQIFFEKTVALFYLLLYLCIWKFLPIVAFVKMLGEIDLIVKL